MVVHIASAHPQYIHKPRKSLAQVRNDSLRRGINNWTKEELLDPDHNKKLPFTTAHLEKDDGQFKCFLCDYSSPVGIRVATHIMAKHPKFVHKKNIHETDFNEHRPSVLPMENASDPEKILRYWSSSDLQKDGGLYKCLCCSYTSICITNVVRHTSSFHPNFVHKPLRWNTINPSRSCPRLGIKTWSKEEVEDPKKILFFASADLQKIDGYFQCFVCSFRSRSSNSVCRHIQRFHTKFILLKSLRNVGARCTENYLSAYTISNIKNGSSNRTGTQFISDSSSHGNTDDGELMEEYGPRWLNDEGDHSWKHTIRNEQQLDQQNDDELNVILDTGEKNTVDGTADSNNHSSEGRKRKLSNEHSTDTLNSYSHHAIPEENRAASPGVCERTQIKKNNLIENTDLIGMDSVGYSNEVSDMVKRLQSVSGSDSKDVLLKELQFANTYLTTSREFWKTKYENAIGKLREEESKNNGIEMNQLVTTKEERDNQITGFYSQLNPLECEKVRVKELEKALEDKDAQLEEMNKRIKELVNSNCKSKNEEMRKEFKSDNADLHVTEEGSDNLSNELHAECLRSGYDALVETRKVTEDNPSVNRCRGMNEYLLGESSKFSEFSGVIKMNFTEKRDTIQETESDGQNLDVPHVKEHVLIRREHVLIRSLITEIENLCHSIAYLKAKHEMEIARMREDFSRKNDVDLNQYQLCHCQTAQEEMEEELNDSHSTIGDRGVSGLLDDEMKNVENVITAKEKEIKKPDRKSAHTAAKLAKQLQLERENTGNLEKELIASEMRFHQMKSKNGALLIQMKCEREKAKDRAEELAKKLSDAEHKLQNCTRKVELGETEDKLKLEAEQAKRAKEKHLREIEKFQAELIFID